MRCRLQAQQPSKLGSQLSAIWCGLTEQVLSAEVVVAAVDTAKAGATNGVGRGNAGEHGHAGYYVEVFALGGLL